MIGAGASGMLAAYSAASRGARVLLLEKNEKAGKKIYITGKGRCNLTNACDMEDFFDSVVNGRKFLYHAVYSFAPADMMELLEENGCHVKTERGNRVFPVSDHASDVTAALLKALKNGGVKIMYNTPAAEILTRPGSGNTAEGSGIPEEAVRGIKTAYGEVFEAPAAVVCTGGLSYPATGSTGDGYRFARAAGHTVVKQRPSLVPVEVSEKWCASLQGLSLKNVELTAYEEGKKKALYSGFGEMLFTHFGISGPLVLSLSSYLDFTDSSKEQPKRYLLYLDLKPALSCEQLTARIKREFEAAPGRSFANILRTLFPARLSSVMASLSGIDPERKASSLNEKEIGELALLTKKVPLTAVRTRGFNEAVITGGGISLKEINSSTMGSKLVRGLFFAGEVMDADALTGGFNLQIAWSTGHLAGMNAADLANEAVRE